MQKSERWGELKAINFTLDARDVFKMLERGGHIPEGFALDYKDDYDMNDWPIKISAVRYKDEFSFPPKDEPL